MFNRTKEEPVQAKSVPMTTLPADSPYEGEQIVAVERFSRRLNSSDLWALNHAKKATAEETGDVKASSTSRVRRSMIELPTLDGHLTISRLEYLGTMRKSGYLQKQSKYLGRWIKRYFVLTGAGITYFDDEKLTNGKDGVITGDSVVSYTSKENCFIIKGLHNPDGSQAEEWKLMADDEK
jgi:hypothetical protein